MAIRSKTIELVRSVGCFVCVTAGILGSGCSSRATECYPETGYWNYTNYPAPTQDLDPGDREILAKVEACLAPLKEHWLSPEEAKEAECLGTPTFEVRSCLKVAVAPTWHISECTGEEVFDCNVPMASCAIKGQDGGCPCSCRAMIQDDTVIWVTPNRKLLPAYAVTLLTGCINPWTKTLAHCSAPYQP